MRVPARVLRREAHLSQQVVYPALCLGPLCETVGAHRLGDGEAHGETRVERGKRVLKDELDVSP